MRGLEIIQTPQKNLFRNDYNCLPEISPNSFIKLIILNKRQFSAILLFVIFTVEIENNINNEFHK